MVLRNRSSSEIYWTSGPWNRKNFELVPDMSFNIFFKFRFVINENESSFIYYAIHNSSRSRFVMDVWGQVDQLNWLPKKVWGQVWSQPRAQCNVQVFCGAYASCDEESFPICNCLTGFETKSLRSWDLGDYSDGCRRKTQLQCLDLNLGHGQRDRFI